MGKAKRFLGLHLPRNQREDKALNRQSNTFRSQNITPVTQLKGTPNNEFLKATGGIHFGADGYLSDVLNIATGILDLKQNPSGDIVKVRKYININPETGTTDTLDLIAMNGEEFPHQELVFIGQSGDTITITHDSGSASGNNRAILCPGAVTYTLNGSDAVALFYDSTLSKWRIEGDATSGGGGGDNLGNHTATEPLKLASQDLYFVAGGAEFMDHGGSSDIRLYTASTLRIDYTAVGQIMQSGYKLVMDDEITFTGITKPVSNTSSKIYAENLTNDELVLNAPSSGAVRVDINGTKAADIAASGAVFESSSGYGLTLSDTSTPTVDDGSIGKIDFQGLDHLGGGDIFARINAIQTDITSGTEDGSLELSVVRAGVSLDSKMTLGPNDVTLQSGEAIDYISYRKESSPTTGLIGSLIFKTEDSASNVTSFGIIEVDADVVTNGSEDSRFTMKAIDAGTTVTFLEYDNGGLTLLDSTTQELGFYGSAGNTKQTLSGARDNPEAALAGLLVALENLGLIVDSTTAS